MMYFYEQKAKNKVKNKNWLDLIAIFIFYIINLTYVL